jgi:hypothetical protein
MAKKFLSPIDLTKLEIRNAVAHVIAGDASSPVEGQFWYDSSAKRLRFRTDAASLTVVTGGGDLTAGSVANTALTTNPLDRANHSGTQAASTISDLATVVQAYRLDQFAAPTASVSFNSQKITNLLDPTTAQDAATKNYVDGLVQGFSWKQLPVKVASTAAVTLATGVENGDSIDGVTLVTGDRVLLKNQAAAAENGIYTVNASGAPTRATDADTTAELRNATVWVSQGTTNADTAWTQTAEITTVGTTSQSWAQVGGGTSVSGGNGLVLTGSVLDVVAGTGIVANANDVAIDTTLVVRKYATDVGDNSSTSITVTHNLGTRDVTVEVYQATSTYDKVECDVLHATTNTITLVFAVAPTTAQYRCVVHG